MRKVAETTKRAGLTIEEQDLLDLLRTEMLLSSNEWLQEYKAQAQKLPKTKYNERLLAIIYVELSRRRLVYYPIRVLADFAQF